MISLFVDQIHEAAKTRPPGYLEDVLASGTIVGSIIQIPDEKYTELRAKYQPDLPPLTTQGLEALKAIADEAASKLLGEKSISYEQYQARLDICKGCPEITAEKRCTLCGCFMEVKARFRTRNCPANPPRWPALQD